MGASHRRTTDGGRHRTTPSHRATGLSGCGNHPLPCKIANGTTGVDPTGPRGWTMSELAEGVETIEQRRVDKPAQSRTYEERLQIAKRIVQDILAVGIDCELVEAAS